MYPEDGEAALDNGVEERAAKVYMPDEPWF
jgi:hypothetical protein